MKKFLSIFFFILLCAGLGWAEEKRVALVIGNGAYASGALANAVNDAQDVSAAFRETGFDVTLVTNATQRQMRDAVKQFGEKLKNADAGVFYYSGHGMQAGGENFLIPLQADIQSEDDLQYDTVKANDVLKNMENSQCKVNIVILDACRDNPFKSASRGGTRGLAVVEVSHDIESIIVYSTAPGKTAADGKGRNSPFTESLIKNIKKPGLDILSLFRDVAGDVKAVTGGAQIPWMNTSLTKQFSFMSGKSGASQPSSSQTVSVQNTAVPKMMLTGTVQTGNRIIEVRYTDSKTEQKTITVHPDQKSSIMFDYIPVSGKKETATTNSSMVLVVGGTFQMGSNSGRSDEKPVHSVTVDSFYISKYEVTQEEYSAVMGSNPSNFLSNPSSWGGVPLTSNSSWDAAVCNMSANGYRLPTEAEWEYTARGGSKSRGYTYSGSNALNSAAWYDDNTSIKTHQAGLKLANELGLYDMSGNICEWCWDWFEPYSSSAQNNPSGAASGSKRVRRGGSWGSFTEDCTVFRRIGSSPNLRSGIIGFRVVRSRL